MGHLKGVRRQHHQVHIFKTKLLNLIPTDLTTNTQAYSISIQVSSGSKSEEINKIPRRTLAHIEVQVTGADYTMVVLQGKGGQQPLRNIVLQAAVYDSLRKRTFIPIQEMKK